jgi:hypothetical protein
MNHGHINTGHHFLSYRQHQAIWPTIQQVWTCCSQPTERLRFAHNSCPALKATTLDSIRDRTTIYCRLRHLEEYSRRHVSNWLSSGSCSHQRLKVCCAIVPLAQLICVRICTCCHRHPRSCIITHSTATTRDASDNEDFSNLLNSTSTRHVSLTIWFSWYT